MPTYERRTDTDEVLERVRTVDGSLEDTRLGVAALEGRGGWARVDETSPAAPVPAGERAPEIHAPTAAGEVLDTGTVRRRKGKSKED